MYKIADKIFIAHASKGGKIEILMNYSDTELRGILLIKTV